MTYLEPLLSVFLAICFIAWMRLSKHGNRKALLAVGLLGLFLVSWAPAEWLLTQPLLFPYPVQSFHVPAPPPEAIVVLGGGIDPPRRERPYPVADLDTVQHCAMAAWIHKQMEQAPVLGCEGYRGANRSVMRELLRGENIPDDLIWIEDRSRNTHENALYGAAILKQHGIQRIALVTDAQSMLRAAACFRKQGIAVVPAPCDFGQPEFTVDDLLPNWKAIRHNERTLHETLALAWYSLRGWI